MNGAAAEGIINKLHQRLDEKIANCNSQFEWRNYSLTSTKPDAINSYCYQLQYHLLTKNCNRAFSKLKHHWNIFHAKTLFAPKSDHCFQLSLFPSPQRFQIMNFKHKTPDPTRRHNTDGHNEARLWRFRRSLLHLSACFLLFLSLHTDQFDLCLRLERLQDFLWRSSALSKHRWWVANWSHRRTSLGEQFVCKNCLS